MIKNTNKSKTTSTSNINNAPLAFSGVTFLTVSVQFNIDVKVLINNS